MANIFQSLTPVLQMEVPPRSVEHPISLPYRQPSHEPRPPPQTPNQAPVTLNTEFNVENYWGEAPTPPTRERREGKY